MDPELAKALASHPVFSLPLQPPPEGVSPAEYERQGAEALHGPFIKFHEERLLPESQYVVVNKEIPVQNGQIAIRVLQPLGDDHTTHDNNTTYPALVWFHGGGMAVGGLYSDDVQLRSVCVELQLVIINVDYRLAPEHKFPTAFEDCYAAVRWVIENHSELRVALDKGFLVGGDSAGANLAATVALHARDDPSFRSSGKAITGQYLREPAVVHPLHVPDTHAAEIRSFVESCDTVLLDRAKVFRYLDAYAPSPTDPRAAVLHATSHIGLPPAFIQVNEVDVVRDHGVVYERVLREAGVPTKLVRYPGGAHSFFYYFPEISASAKVDRDMRDGLRWLLSGCGGKQVA
ncbi:Alpha/Beta hydrolase protein [Earliella scabrosa]|nr:Alpha/Beta hydrolase protein [Earliella scabrosa]